MAWHVLLNQIDVKNSTIAEQKNQIEDLEAKLSVLQKELEGYAGTDGTLQNMEALVKVTNPNLQLSLLHRNPYFHK